MIKVGCLGERLYCGTYKLLGILLSKKSLVEPDARDHLCCLLFLSYLLPGETRLQASFSFMCPSLRIFSILFNALHKGQYPLVSYYGQIASRV